MKASLNLIEPEEDYQSVAFAGVIDRPPRIVLLCKICLERTRVGNHYLSNV